MVRENTHLQIETEEDADATSMAQQRKETLDNLSITTDDEDEVPNPKVQFKKH